MISIVSGKKEIITAIVCIVLQFFAVVFTHNFMVAWYTASHPVSHDISFGISIQLLLVYYILLLIVQNCIVLNTSKTKWLLASFVSLAFMPMALLHMDRHPLKSIHITTIGIAGFWTKYILHYCFYKIATQP